MEKRQNSRYTACLLGGAIGDVLGAPVEFMSLDEIRQIHGPQGVSDYCEYPDHIGEFTDDTQMTLFTAEGLLRASHRAVLKGIGGALIPITFHSYLRWLHTQGMAVNSAPQGWGGLDLENGWLMRERDLFKKRSPGNTCIHSLERGIPGTIDKPINNSKGCGAIMRMAPVGLVFLNPQKAFDIGCDLAALTHGHPSGYLSAGSFAAIIQQLASGQDLLESINSSRELLLQYSGHEETLNAINQSVNLYHHTNLSPPATGLEMAYKMAQLGQGWIGEEALAISLFCSLVYEHDFKTGVLASVNHSGDSDSTGSITGNILGLINGIEVIPEKWIKNLKSGSIVRQIGEDLYTRCKSEIDDPDKEWWDKYPEY